MKLDVSFTLTLTPRQARGLMHDVAKAQPGADAEAASKILGQMAVQHLADVIGKAETQYLVDLGAQEDERQQALTNSRALAPAQDEAEEKEGLPA